MRQPGRPQFGGSLRPFGDIGPFELGPPGPPTTFSVLEWGDTYVITRWTERGDEWDTAAAASWKVVANETEIGSGGSCSVPGTVHTKMITGLTSCSGYTLKVRTTAADGQRRSDSNAQMGTTCCGPECQGTRPGARAIATLDLPLRFAIPAPNPTRGRTTIAWSVPRGERETARSDFVRPGGSETRNGHARHCRAREFF